MHLYHEALYNIGADLTPPPLTCSSRTILEPENGVFPHFPQAARPSYSSSFKHPLLTYDIQFHSTHLVMPRSRKGCATCKRRHRKCDETRPRCFECLQSGLECEGYKLKLQWDVGIASRGHFRGAAAPVSTSSPPDAHWSPPGTIPAAEPNQSSPDSAPGTIQQMEAPSPRNFNPVIEEQLSPDSYWTAEQGRNLIGSFDSPFLHPTGEKTRSLAALDPETKAIFDECKYKSECTLLFQSLS